MVALPSGALAMVSRPIHSAPTRWVRHWRNVSDSPRLWRDCLLRTSVISCRIVIRSPSTSRGPPVWPDARGTVRGLALEPVHISVVEAANRDPALGEPLSLVDALRIGDARIGGTRRRSAAQPPQRPRDVSIELLELGAAARGESLPEVVFVGGSSPSSGISAFAGTCGFAGSSAEFVGGHATATNRWKPLAG